MNTNLTEIAFVLDRSGSMSQCMDSTIEGFNAFLAEQKKQAGLARFTLTLFDDRYEVPYLSIPISEVTDLSERTFVPRGTTALLDAVCQTIDHLGERLAAQPEGNRAGQVIVAIMTDGLENASQKFTWKDVSDRIQHQSEVYKWIFLFLGASQDAIATAAKMSIAASNASAYKADTHGSKSSHRSMSRKMSAYRNLHAGTATPEDIIIAEAPLQQIVEEDDRDERGNSGGQA